MRMKPEQALRAIEALRPAGMKWGLDRMRRALALCGHPESTLRFVHVAGTKGKGSTARMIQCILSAAGFRTGLYSSPAVTGVRDTVTVDGQPISGEDFSALTERLLALSGQMGEEGALTEFELVTVLALLYFSQKKVDVAVLECGLGGRDDATNVIPPPLAAVLTPVSLDHTAVLGNTVELIAKQKCGILKAPCAVVTSPVQDEEALGVLYEQAAHLGLTVRVPARAGSTLLSTELGRTVFTYDGMILELPLTGAFQRDNALTAIETVRALVPHGFAVSEQAIASGLRRATLPCRQEVLCRDPLVLLDGAHNPQCAAALADTLEQVGRRDFTLILGMLADKDYPRCVALLLPFCRRILCCTPDSPRALPGRELAEAIRRQAPSFPVEIADTPQKALALAQTDGGRTPLLATGSFLVAGPVRGLLMENRPDPLSKSE